MGKLLPDIEPVSRERPLSQAETPIGFLSLRWQQTQRTGAFRITARICLETEEVLEEWARTSEEAMRKLEFRLQMKIDLYREFLDLLDTRVWEVELVADNDHTSATNPGSRDGT
jgi:hypothetical protein